MKSSVAVLRFAAVQLVEWFTFQCDCGQRDIPAIMVSSRNQPEDFARGKLAGAVAYIVKGEFDQGQLLQTIRTLIG